MSTTLSREPAETPDGPSVPIHGTLVRAPEADPPGLVMGRPVEEWSFEAVVTGIGIAAGLAVGAAVAGPTGVAIGGLAGTAVGLVATRVVERAAGPAATTTNCGSPTEISTTGSGDASEASPTVSGPSRGRAFITYPTDYLLSVADTKTELASAVAALAGAGLSAPDVVVIAGPAGERLERLGTRHSPLSRLVRMVQFTTMDQTPDFSAYEAALRDGRTVVAVRIDAGQVPAVREALLASGLHFLNFYGRWSTMEVAPWRGPEVDLPDYLRR